MPNSTPEKKPGRRGTSMPFINSPPSTSRPASTSTTSLHWAMEYHDTAGSESKWIPVNDKGAYDIQLRTLTSVDTSNLYAAGRAADGDQYAGGSLRVMGTALATGHAAGVAAALHASAGKPIPAAQVQQELQRPDARLTGT